jgi:TolB protein
LADNSFRLYHIHFPEKENIIIKEVDFQGIIMKIYDGGYGGINRRMKTQKQTIRFSKILLILILLIAVAAAAIPGWPFLLNLFQKPISENLTEPSQLSSVPSSDDSEEANSPVESTGVEEIIPEPAIFNGKVIDEGIIVLSMADGLQNSLFLYHPQYMSYKRITNPESNDINPAISPDGSQIAFSSRRNGFWDIYLLNMLDASLVKITDTPEFEGHPSWSPDGKWIVYEKYENDNFEIYLQALDQLDEAPINLTQTNSNEFSPTWSPNGRILAYLSDANGSIDVWTADLNNSDQRFVNLTNSTTVEEKSPVWNPDGTRIGWSADVNHFKTIYQYELATKTITTQQASGDSFIWSPDGTILLSIAQQPNGSSMNFYKLDGDLVYPTQFMHQTVDGMDWSAGKFVENVNQYPFSQFSDSPQAILYESAIDTNPAPPLGRFAVVPLANVSAPYPYIHDLADESFDGLRYYIAKQTGWDVLNSLENAFIPITVPSEIWNHENWFYTGRAIALTTSPIGAGWIILLKEESFGETYWRVFAKCRYQDGSQGRPLTTRRFNLDARLEGDPEIYDLGGMLTSIPAGYWVDFTELAYRFDWERLPAMLQWQTFYPAARFNIFIFRQNLDWSQAMREIVPLELIPTAVYPIDLIPDKPIVSPPVNPPAEPTQNSPVSIRPTWTPGPDLDKP